MINQKTKKMECKTCEEPHLLNDCSLNYLAFRDDKANYIPTREEYNKYISYLKSKNFTQKRFNADLSHYKSFFSKGFNSIEEVLPYAQKAMRDHFPVYIGKIVGPFRIEWRKM